MLKKIFLPNLHKQQRSFAILPHTMVGYAAFVLFLLLFLKGMVAGNVLGYATDVNVTDLLEYTNETRNKAGLADLKTNAQLTAAAQAKAADMFKYDYWAHTSPNNKEPWDFINESGYEYIYAGENLAVDFGHSKSVVEAWYDSPSHRENLMSDKYTEIGFAVVNGKLQGRDTTLIVQMFGYPRNPIPLESVTDPSTDAVVLELPAETDVLISKPGLENVRGIPQEAVVGDKKPLVSVDILQLSQTLALVLGLYLVVTFAIDGFYVKKHGALRISGHTFLHILIFIFVVVGIWYTNVGLVL